MERKTIFKISAVISGISGLVIILGVVLPIIKYEMDARKKYPVLLSPLGNLKTGVLGVSFRDTTKVSNWFEGKYPKDGRYLSGPLNYFLSVPKLKIENASVLLEGEDLSRNLIQYPGTSLPGKIGNSVIFGHSVSPIFYNPKNYLSIFSTLPTLKKGDEIRLIYDEVLFKYVVEDMFEVLPEDMEILEQDTTDSFLTLVTCVPPGDPRMPRRLVVRARIVPF